MDGKDSILRNKAAGLWLSGSGEISKYYEGTYIVHPYNMVLQTLTKCLITVVDRGLSNNFVQRRFEAYYSEIVCPRPLQTSKA